MLCKHAFVPSNFCGGRITPVPKKAGKCDSFDDFRPITTVNALGKIFEYCLLSKLEPCLDFHELQFGFTRGGGCVTAIHVLRTVTEYFIEHGSNVYVSALDISKAYDRLNHCIIILKLRRLNVPIDIILLFMFWLQHLFAVVRWNGIDSVAFDIKSGVRQGGVCSAWIFNVYINDLIYILEDSGFGCHMHGLFVGCILYADDVLLMSGSVLKLQYMLDLCHDYANSHELMFNSKKSGCLAFGTGYVENVLTDMSIGIEKIKWVSNYVYLGVNVIAGREFKTDIETGKRKFCAAINDVISHAQFLSEECIMHIINVQCLPILGYGAGVWNVNYETKRSVGVCFNDAIRKLFHYNRWESVRNILLGFRMLPMDIYLVQSRLLLIRSAMLSNRKIVKLCGNYVFERDDFVSVLLKFRITNILSKSLIMSDIWNYLENDM